MLKRLQAELGGTRVFAVGVDTAVNDGFLRRLAAIGGGTSTFVEPGARLEEALEAVGREIGAPLVTELRLSGDVADIAPARVPDLFAGRPSTVFFRLSGGPVKVTGKLAGGGRFEQEIAAREAPLAAIDHLWARARIADMEDEFRGSRSDAVKKEIVAISIRHTVLTRFTAFVVTDDQVVNAGGSRRTVVQPVEMPAEWEMDPMAGIPLTRARGLVLSSPVRAASTYPAGGTSRMPTVKAQASGAMGRFPGKLMDALIRRPPRDEAATAEQREKVQQALEAFLRAFAAAKAGAAAAQLEQARIELLRALGESLAIATAVPLLQAFLRGAAVELVAALTASAADSALFARHARALDEAREQARAALGVANAPAGSFWESSI